MPNITPFLWFDHQAEEAAAFYVSLFPNSRIVRTARYLEDMPLPAGTVMVVDFLLDGKPFAALNGGPVYQFSSATSFVIDCRDQAEVDHYWGALLSGGKAQACGWLTDKYGVTWQVVPTVLHEMMSDKDPARVARVTAAMMQMVKLEIAPLVRAYSGED